MSAIQTLDVMPIDPYLKTGPSRIMSGPVRMRTVVLDEPYGEFATWLYAGNIGNVTIVEWDGTTIQLENLAPGVWHPVYSLQVNSSGTSASPLLWGS